MSISDVHTADINSTGSLELLLGTSQDPVDSNDIERTSLPFQLNSKLQKDDDTTCTDENNKPELLSNTNEVKEGTNVTNRSGIQILLSKNIQEGQVSNETDVQLEVNNGDQEKVAQAKNENIPTLENKHEKQDADDANKEATSIPMKYENQGYIIETCKSGIPVLVTKTADEKTDLSKFIRTGFPVTDKTDAVETNITDIPVTVSNTAQESIGTAGIFAPVSNTAKEKTDLSETNIIGIPVTQSNIAQEKVYGANEKPEASENSRTGIPKLVDNKVSEKTDNSETNRTDIPQFVDNKVLGKTDNSETNKTGIPKLVDNKVLEKTDNSETNRTGIPKLVDNKVLVKTDNSETNKTGIPKLVDNKVLEKTDNSETNRTGIPKLVDNKVLEKTDNGETNKTGIPKLVDNKVLEKTDNGETNKTGIPKLVDNKVLEKTDNSGTNRTEIPTLGDNRVLEKTDSNKTNKNGIPKLGGNRVLEKKYNSQTIRTGIPKLGSKKVPEKTDTQKTKKPGIPKLGGNTGLEKTDNRGRNKSGIPKLGDNKALEKRDNSETNVTDIPPQVSNKSQEEHTSECIPVIQNLRFDENVTSNSINTEPVNLNHIDQQPVVTVTGRIACIPITLHNTTPEDGHTAIKTSTQLNIETLNIETKQELKVNIVESPSVTDGHKTGIPLLLISKPEEESTTTQSHTDFQTCETVSTKKKPDSDSEDDVPIVISRAIVNMDLKDSDLSSQVSITNSESNMSNIVKVNYSCKNSMTKKPRTGDFVPSSASDRPLIIGHNFENMVEEWVNKLRIKGGVINNRVVMAAAEGIIMKTDKTKLSKFGGTLKITEPWAQSFLNSMGFVKRNWIKSVRKLPKDFDNIKTKFGRQLSDMVAENSIPDELVVNWDQTEVSMIPDWAMDKEGTWHVTVTGIEYMRHITVLMASSKAGVMLPPQLIYEGKSDRCHPQINFPTDWDITHTESHKSTEASMLRYIDEVLIPYYKKQRTALKLRPTQKCLAIFDANSAHLGQNLLAKLYRNNILSVFVPASCTAELQPLDLSVKKPFQDELKKCFQQWYAHEVMKKSTDDGHVNTRTSILKPIHASWLIKAYEKLSRRKLLIQTGYLKAGILNKSVSNPNISRKLSTKQSLKNTSLPPEAIKEESAVDVPQTTEAEVARDLMPRSEPISNFQSPTEAEKQNFKDNPVEDQSVRVLESEPIATVEVPLNRSLSNAMPNYEPDETLVTDEEETKPKDLDKQIRELEQQWDMIKNDKENHVGNNNIKAVKTEANHVGSAPGASSKPKGGVSCIKILAYTFFFVVFSLTVSVVVMWYFDIRHPYTEVVNEQFGRLQPVKDYVDERLSSLFKS